ncbi:hypothetical protein [Cupriavidus sp. D39]|nr:hypothetical protein [Cupriavidus sp. D39]MCY0853538.1 hypothetical protein [Cupriavidus sp. D39]
MRILDKLGLPIEIVSRFTYNNDPVGVSWRPIKQEHACAASVA